MSAATHEHPEPHVEVEGETSPVPAVAATRAVPRELVTPTAYELSAAEPETPAWFAHRREGITATDVPKLLGLSRWGNALSVWLDKRGELPREEAGEAAVWGQVLEEPIARQYVARRDAEEPPGRPVALATVGTLAHAQHPWMRASLDRLVLDWNTEELLGALEVKNRNAYAAGTWRDGVPDDVLAQVVWQLLVTGLPWCDVAVLLGGNRLLIHRVTLTDDGVGDVAELCRREAHRVWQHVLHGTPPHVDPDATLLDLLARLYPERDGVRDLDEDQAESARDWIVALDEARDRARQAKADAKRAEAALVQLLDDAEHAAAGGDVLISYPVRQRAAHTVEATTYRQLLINRKAL